MSMYMVFSYILMVIYGVSWVYIVYIIAGCVNFHAIQWGIYIEESYIHPPIGRLAKNQQCLGQIIRLLNKQFNGYIKYI